MHRTISVKAVVHIFPVSPFFRLCLSITLASHVPIHAEEKTPAATFTNSLGMRFVWISPTRDL